MTKIVLTLVLAFAASTAFAAEPGVGYGGSVGALSQQTRGLATNANEVRAQGGFATAAAVHWTQVPEAQQKLSAVAY